MDRILIKPYNEIFKGIELYNDIAKRYEEIIEEKITSRTSKHGIIVGDSHRNHRIIKKLNCELNKDTNDITLSFQSGYKTCVLLDANINHLGAYQNLGVAVHIHLLNAMDLAQEKGITVQKDYEDLLKKRYDNICDLAEKVTQQRIERGITGHLTVFHEPTAHCDDPIRLAEFEDEFKNTRGSCCPANGVEYYHVMCKFLECYYKES